MSRIATLGNLSRDVVASAGPRPGGGVFYSARALARLGADAHVAAACSAADRASLLPALEAFGLPVTWYESGRTTAYRFHYEGDRRVMTQDAVGDPWTPERALEAAGDAAWVNVCALARTDFPEETLAALAGGRRLLVDAQGLVRRPELGPLRMDGEIGGVLAHLAILKLDAEEAVALVGSADPERVRVLAVPEVVLTLGSQGAWVLTSTLAEHVPASPLAEAVDPTGAGDTFAAAYLARRVEGAEPVEAARDASEVVSALLAESA